MQDYFADVTYGSTLYFELWYDEHCMEQLRDELCYKVKMLHNGVPLKFDTCIEANRKNGNKDFTCTYSDFRAHILKMSYIGVIEDKCNEPWSPPTA